MKLLLTVQGEGRGHMTQALAFQQWSRRQGHEVVAVLAGQNRSRNWPDYFERGFDQPVQPLASPGFVYRRGRALNWTATVWQFLRRAKEFRASLQHLEATIRRTRPHLVVNFLEPLVGLRSWCERTDVPVLAVGHQFMLDHPGYVKLPAQRFQQWGLQQWVAATGRKATHYALSLFEDTDDPGRRRVVGPPLLREELFQLPAVEEDFLLVYLLNDGYRVDLERWHARRPGQRLHCFYDRAGAPETEVVDDTLSFHRLHGERFLQYMARCRGVVCTAGFEAISEAAWLGKPVFAVPVENHLEQTLNALDLERCELGISGSSFELDRLLEVPPRRAARKRFRDWLGRSDERLERAVEFATGRAPEPRSEGRRLRPALIA